MSESRGKRSARPATDGITWQRAPNVGEQQIDYEVFVNAVRKHSPTQLLPLLAKIQLANRDRRDYMESGFLPWAIACIAKESLRVGRNGSRVGTTPQSIRELCSLYGATRDPLAHDSTDVGSVAWFFVRTAYEQFECQENQMHEIARSWAMYGPRSDGQKMRIIDDALWHRVFKCSLRDYMGVGFVMSAGAELHQGFFDPSWVTQDNFESVATQVPREAIMEVANRHFASNAREFRQVAQSTQSHDHRLRKHDFNPLKARPFVAWSDGRFLAPAPHLVRTKLGPAAIYHAGLDALRGDSRAESNFTADIGLRFEEYLHHQLDSLDAEIIREFTYDRDGNKKSVDFFLIWDNLTLLVEAKTTRLRQASRMGARGLKEDIDRTVGKAFEQIDLSAELTRIRHHAFTRVPDDRPIRGLVVTLEPYYMANSPTVIRSLLTNPKTQTLVASASGVERLVALAKSRPANERLLEIYGDEERCRWDLGPALGDEQARNSFLDEVWDELPFTDGQEAQ